MPTGVDGEVLIAGPNVMRGYLGRPDETARVIIDGWLHTGDIGHLDTDGYLTLVGRSKDMIIRGGENIYPKEIEDVLTSDPAVLEAAVIGVPDDKWGETVAAYVPPRPGHTINPEALHALCARKLAGYKRPTTITVMDAIPKNAVGKTDKGPLRAAHPPRRPRTPPRRPPNEGIRTDRLRQDQQRRRCRACPTRTARRRRPGPESTPPASIPWT